MTALLDADGRQVDEEEAYHRADRGRASGGCGVTTGIDAVQQVLDRAGAPCHRYEMGYGDGARRCAYGLLNFDETEDA